MAADLIKKSLFGKSAWGAIPERFFILGAKVGQTHILAKNKGFADSLQSLDFPNGALGRNRTGTGLLPTDFKSAASTCSATSALTLNL